MSKADQYVTVKYLGNDAHEFAPVTGRRKKMTNDGLSRCECCDDVTPSHRLRQVTGVTPYPKLPVSLCQRCESVLIDLEMQYRQPQTVGHIRTALALR